MAEQGGVKERRRGPRYRRQAGLSRFRDHRYWQQACEGADRGGDAKATVAEEKPSIGSTSHRARHRCCLRSQIEVRAMSFLVAASRVTCWSANLKKRSRRRAIRDFTVRRWTTAQAWYLDIGIQRPRQQGARLQSLRRWRTFGGELAAGDGPANNPPREGDSKQSGLGEADPAGGSEQHCRDSKGAASNTRVERDGDHDRLAGGGRSSADAGSSSRPG